ncbi:hypothetical protein EU537_00570 [Candidatus Thorarchaeota archaeon]|nr:MAG: hypothetical protein EU537_00570 [Candidatus Thorarchaeota archaeon]
MDEYDWQLFGDVEMFLEELVKEFVKNQEFVSRFSKQIAAFTSTKLIDWIDHIILPWGSEMQEKLTAFGFEHDTSIDAPDELEVYSNNKSIFFPIILSNQSERELVLHPEKLEHFIRSIGEGHNTEGEMYAPYRRCLIEEDEKFKVSAIERRGYNGYQVQAAAEDIDQYQDAFDSFRLRRRRYEDSEEGMEALQNLVEEVADGLKPARMADAFFRAERIFWQSRDWAGQIQKERQDKFGLGWGNHDHHTYRSSREHFMTLIAILETMGFSPRERFFAGESAGWGAQILEQQECKIVVFADIDISATEKEIDFAHTELDEKESLGTVGLWTAIHGESILEAGLHHLATRVDFAHAQKSLESFGVEVMKPFSDFSFLKQAFTGAKRRDVEKKRLDALLEEGFIGERSYDNFVENGAIGSHLEVIERRQGFKGFNQDSVTAIIRATDPRDYDVRRA